MKPCFGKRKLIAWLALGQLDASRAQALRAHLETCEPCRRYLAELSAVTHRLAAQPAEPEIEASTAFHRHLLHRLRAQPSAFLWETLAARLNRRLALPALGAAVLVVLFLSLLPRQPVAPPPVQISLPAAKPPTPAQDLPPTIANYQQAAYRSLDELDELLTRQAGRPLPPAPLYTASSFSLD